jgi:hypothetical protein
VRQTGKCKRNIDQEWKRLKAKSITPENRDRLYELRRQEVMLWVRKGRFLRGYAKRYGIPPIDPATRSINRDVDDAIQTWAVGKWNMPAWTVDDEEDAEVAKMEQNIVIDPQYSLPKIITALEKVVKAERSKRFWKLKLILPWAAPKESFFDDYVMAWYLHERKGWGWTDIAYELFGDRRKSRADKARKYALCGGFIHNGRPEQIRDEMTPGVHPQRDQHLQQQRDKILSKLHKKGVGKRVK